MTGEYGAVMPSTVTRITLSAVAAATLASSLLVASPALAKGVARPVFGSSEHPSDDLATNVADFKQLKALGETTVRSDFSWSGIEPQGHGDPSTYNWTHNDAMAGAAEQLGMHVDAMLGYGNKLYSEAGTANDSNDYPPDDPADYAQFATDVAQRYETQYPGVVTSYEIWNEPNVSARFWSPAADPAAYAELLCAAYPAIKAVAPDAMVIAAGLDMPPSGDIPTLIMGGREFADKMLTAIGTRKCFDALSYHPYASPFVSPEAVVKGNGNRSVATDADDLRATLKQHGYPASTPLYDTEIGWPTNPDANGVTEEMQARYLVRTMLLSWQRGVSNVYVYDQFDSGDAATNNNQESHFGIFHSDGTPKPAVKALTVFNKTLPKGWTYTADLSRKLKLPKGTKKSPGVNEGYALEFTGPKKQHIIALWYANENVPNTGCASGINALNCAVMSTLPKAKSISVKVGLPKGAKKVAITTMMGKKVKQPTVMPATGRVTRGVKAGQEPVYIAWTGSAYK